MSDIAGIASTLTPGQAASLIEFTRDYGRDEISAGIWQDSYTRGWQRSR